MAYAATGAGGSIEHAQLIRRDDVRRMAELGVRASVQPAHLLDDRDATERVWAGPGEPVLRAALDARRRRHASRWAPTPPSPRSTRGWRWRPRSTAAATSASPWHPEQALTPREALAASVDDQGTVRAGSRGDLVLLDADPLDAADDSAEQADRLRDMHVHATWVAGRAGPRRALTLTG